MQYQTQEDYDRLPRMLSSPKHLWGILLQSCMTLWCYWCMQSWFWWWILIWMAHQASVKTRALVNPIWIWWTSKKNLQCNWDPWGTTYKPSEWVMNIDQVYTHEWHTVHIVQWCEVGWHSLGPERSDQWVGKPRHQTNLVFHWGNQQPTWNESMGTHEDG